MLGALRNRFLLLPFRWNDTLIPRTQRSRVARTGATHGLLSLAFVKPSSSPSSFSHELNRPFSRREEAGARVSCGLFMEAGQAASWLSSSSSFASSSASPPSPSPTSAQTIPCVCSLASRTSLLKSAAHPLQSQRNQLAPIMATSEPSPGSTCNDAVPSSSSPVGGPRTSVRGASSAIDFLMLCQRLKTTKRAGWVNHGLKETESIADHMYRMAVMAIISSDLPGVNKDRCVKMAVIHDIAEAIVGDITPSDGIPKEEKSRRERAAIDEMCALLDGILAAQEVKELWMEYESNATPEANLVKDFDKVEMILQALEYETTQGKTLDDFYESTAGKFQTEVGKAWAAEIVARRKKRQDALKHS